MNKAVRIRLILMNFLQWAVWGAYLTSMGSYLVTAGLAEKIGLFYAMQGIVSMFMPAIIGIIADKYIPAQRLLGFCHLIAGAAMIAAGYYGLNAGSDVRFGILFPLYSLSVAFYMPTIALSNSVAFRVLGKNGFDTVKDFPPVRVFGTVGFICSMLFVNFMTDGAGVQFQHTYNQFFVSGVIGVLLFLYCFTLPACPVNRQQESQSIADALGAKAFRLFKDRGMATFFIFSMLLGVALQITNGFANPFISHFKEVPEFAGTWGAKNANALISISQMSETLGILLIPVAMKFFGIKRVMLIAMIAWVFRFGLFGLGDPGSGVWMFVLSMIVYGVAFDFFNISGALYVEQRSSDAIKSSAQGLFMLMTNGIGATIGTLSAQAVVNHFVYEAAVPNWSAAWFVFAGYALVVAVLFAICFKNPGKGPYSKIA
ncbi:MAG: MFS transporter [Bacteroidetes bacterium]|uniref:MFS transporter n=1 Tax=Candidatus Cryptobacteroides faecigallinarum TaxID=2840763 RepID=A0A9D9IMU8_9BACT|nr:MFS transporter [Candidatus Cryptobacteroides faecigallinarum]